jgi:molybdate transport system substrate-binding protein
MAMNFRRKFLGLVAAAALAGVTSAHAKDAKPVTVYAASSLTDALNEVAHAYEASGHAKPVFSYASSAQLARQIEQGARADMFVSADETWMDYLAERKLIVTASRASILSNKLVLVAPAASTMNLKIGSGFDLSGALNGGKLSMADPESVPAGKYGKAALQSLGVWGAVEPSVAKAENVRAALRFVETGDAPAGIVYLTDAMASGSKVKVIGEFPPSSYPKISYPIALVKGAKGGAKPFADYLRSPTAVAIFKRQGFIIQ